jgi:CO/xanthine dehydrogenase Mo-binding subunit
MHRPRSPPEPTDDVPDGGTSTAHRAARAARCDVRRQADLAPARLGQRPSILDDYKENCGEATPHLYSCANLRVTSALAHRNVGTPTSMRGPGAVPGLWATESAMDELAIALAIDPVELRLRNETAIDEGLKLPFSSRHLKECYATGIEKFGWSKRNPAVGSMKRYGLTLGWGMAAASWLAERFSRVAAWNCATTAPRVSRARRRTSAPARTPCSRS